MKKQAGFSLVELMVGMLIGLICTIVIASVLSAAEGQRRGTTQGSDAQVNGSLALYTLQREVAMAGYGFATEPNALGCALQVKWASADVNILPAQLAPVFITQGAAGASDTLRVLSSSKYIYDEPGNDALVGYTVPSRVVPPLYDPADVTGNFTKTGYTVASTLSVSRGDLMVAVIDADRPCGLFEVNASAATGGLVPRIDDAARWNAVGHPAQKTVGSTNDGATTTPGSALVNLGRVVDVQYTVDANQKLTKSELSMTTRARTSSELQSNVVLLKALYGRDTDNDGAVDTYDYTTPASNAGWLGVLTVRVAVVARSAQFEKDEVTKVNPQWDVGTATTVAGAATCGASKCVALKLDTLPDWKHYRYRVFDTVISLRNQRWKTDTNLNASP